MVNNRTDMEELFAAREHLSCELTHLWDVRREKDIKTNKNTKIPPHRRKKFYTSVYKLYTMVVSYSL